MGGRSDLLRNGSQDRSITLQQRPTAPPRHADVLLTASHSLRSSLRGSCTAVFMLPLPSVALAYSELANPCNLGSRTFVLTGLKVLALLPPLHTGPEGQSQVSTSLGTAADALRASRVPGTRYPETGTNHTIGTYKSLLNIGVLCTAKRGFRGRRRHFCEAVTEASIPYQRRSQLDQTFIRHPAGCSPCFLEILPVKH